MNPNSISPRSTSPSHDSNSLRPINYSSQQRHSVSAGSGGKQYPYDVHLSPTLSSKQPITSTPLKPGGTHTLNAKISMIQQNQMNEINKESSTEPALTGSLAERGRERKKTTIFGTLRKRLSRSKTRDETTNGNVTNGHQATTTTSDLHTTGSPHMDTVPQLKSSLKSPTGTLTKLGISGSRRSSISEMSGMSGLSRLSSISNKTFLHEASSLVLEVIENGVKRCAFIGKCKLPCINLINL